MIEQLPVPEAGPEITPELSKDAARELMDAAIHRLLSESAQKALETMFFAIPDRVSMDPERPVGNLIACRLTFQGTPSGRFGLLISLQLAGNLAVDFMGSDSVSDLAPDVIDGVMAELTNMLCGVALSELEAHSNFELSMPESARVGALEPAPDFASGQPSVCRFEFPAGALVFYLFFEEQP
jgi:hypothetical protein